MNPRRWHKLKRAVLKGYMYLTKKHICFFAHMPTREVGLNESRVRQLTRSESGCQDRPALEEGLADQDEQQVLGRAQERHHELVRVDRRMYQSLFQIPG